MGILTKILSSLALITAATMAHAHEECVSLTRSLSFDPHSSVGVVHLIFPAQFNSAVKIEFFHLHESDLRDNPWASIKDRTAKETVTANLKFLIQEDDLSTKANLFVDKKFIGFLLLESETKGAITLGESARNALTYELVCKIIPDQSDISESHVK